MDKYQKYLIDRYTGESWFYYINDGTKDQDVKKVEHLNPNWDIGECTIIQFEDPNIIDYNLIIRERQCFAGIAIFQSKHWIDIPKTAWIRENNTSVPVYRLNINFNDRIEKIKISFINNLADDYILAVKYQEADKEKYRAKKEQERKDALLATAAVKCSTGADLVNIYFQPCSDDYTRTEIILYREEQMLAKYKVDEECFFKSITGLAYGTYNFVLKQYDKDNNIILESDEIVFTIRSAKPPIPPRRRVVSSGNW